MEPRDVLASVAALLWPEGETSVCPDADVEETSGGPEVDALATSGCPDVDAEETSDVCGKEKAATES